MQNDLFDGPSGSEADTPVLSELVREISSTPASVIHALGNDLIIEYPHAFDASLSLKVFDAIDLTTPWRQDEIRIAGRTIPVPWTQEMASIRDFVNKVSGTDFNCVLINKYRSGEDSVSWHADDEPELGP